MPFAFKLSEPPCDAYYLSLIDAEALYNTDDNASGELKQETLRQVGWHPIAMPAEWFLSDNARDTTRHVVELLQCTVQYLHHRQKTAEKRLRRLSESQRGCAEERDAAFEELVELRETVATLRRQASEAVPRHRPGRPSQPATDVQSGDGFSCALCGNLYPTAHSLRSHLQKRHRRGEAYAQKAAASAVLVAHMRAAQDELSPDMTPSAVADKQPLPSVGQQPVGQNESAAVADLRGELASMRGLLMQVMAEQKQQQRQSASQSLAAPRSVVTASLATPRAETSLPCGNLPGAADALVPMPMAIRDGPRQTIDPGDAVLTTRDGALRELRGALEQVNDRLGQFEQVLTHLSAVQEATVQRLATRPTTAGPAAATQTTRPQPLSLSALHIYASPSLQQQQQQEATPIVSQVPPNTTDTASAPPTPSLEVVVSPATEASHSAFRADGHTAHTTRQPAAQLPLQQPTAFVHDSATNVNSRYDSSDEDESASRRSAAVHVMATPHAAPTANEPEKSVSPPKFVRTARKEGGGGETHGHHEAKQLPVALSVHNGSVLSHSEPIATPILTPLQASVTPPSSSHIALVEADHADNRNVADARHETSETTARSAHSSPLAPPSVLEVTPQSVTVDDNVNTNNNKNNSGSHTGGEAQMTATTQEAVRTSSQRASTTERSGSNTPRSSHSSDDEKPSNNNINSSRGRHRAAMDGDNIGSPHTATDDAVRPFSTPANNASSNPASSAGKAAAVPPSTPDASHTSLHSHHQSTSQPPSASAAADIHVTTLPSANAHDHSDKASSSNSYSSSPYSSSSSPSPSFSSSRVAHGSRGEHGDAAAHTQTQEEVTATTLGPVATTATTRVPAPQTGHKDSEASGKSQPPAARQPALATPVPGGHDAAPVLTVGHGDRPPRPGLATGDGAAAVQAPRAASMPAPGGASYSGARLPSTAGTGLATARASKGRSSSTSALTAPDSADGAKKSKKKRSFSASIKHFFQGKKSKKEKK